MWSLFCLMKCDVSLPWGENLTSRFSFKEEHVKVTGKRSPVHLIMLEIVDNSVVLSMGQLSRHNIPFLCRRKMAMFQPSVGEVFEYKGTPQRSKWLIVSALKASMMLLKKKEFKRWRVDHQALSKVMIENMYMLPRIDDLKDAKFLKMNLRSDYY